MPASITTLPFPTNNSPKPKIVVGATGSVADTAIAATSLTGSTAAYLPFAGDFPAAAGTPSNAGVVDEGQWAFATFRFESTTAPAGTLQELLDNAALTFTFDGISADDWVPGTFVFGVLGSDGRMLNDGPEDYYTSDFTYGGVANVPAPYGSYAGPAWNGQNSGTDTLASTGWSKVNMDNDATAGTVYFRDGAPLNPAAGTKSYGVVLAVKLVTDTREERGEVVKFKVTQDAASGTVFTQSNYTEANVKVNDLNATLLATPHASGKNASLTINVLGTAADLALVASGTSNTPEKFTLDAPPVLTASTVSTSNWGTTTSFFNISGFDTSDTVKDVLSIDFLGAAPGLSITNFGDVSASFANEAFLITSMRALNGLALNRGGIYLAQAENSTIGGFQATTDASPAGFSTYVLVDTNKNGIADTASASGDLLVRLAGVDAHSLQSINFLLT